MKTFVDETGRTWAIVIHVAAVKKCRALAGVDLYGLLDDGFKGLGALVADPVSLVDVIYVLCKDEADRSGVTDEDFGRAMAGDAIGRATDAFLAELTDFFPDPRVRAGLAKLLDKGRTVRDRVIDRMGAQLDEIDLDAEVERLIASSGSSPGSRASTPTP